MQWAACFTYKIFPVVYSQTKLQTWVMWWRISAPLKHQILKVYMTQCWFHDSRYTKSKWRRKSFNICRWQTWKLPTWPINTSGPRSESVICAPNENINPASCYSGSAAGQATWQSSRATCSIWSEILLPRSSTLTEAMCWPKASAHQNKITLCPQSRNVEGSGLSKCQWLGWGVCI